MFAFAAGLRSCARAAGRRAVTTPQVFLQCQCNVRADTRNLEKLSSGSIHSTFTANAITFVVPGGTTARRDLFARFTEAVKVLTLMMAADEANDLLISQFFVHYFTPGEIFMCN